MFYKNFNTLDQSFLTDFEKYLEKKDYVSGDVEDTVSSIIHGIKTKGDEALLEFTNDLDNRHLNSIKDCSLDVSSFEESLNQISKEERVAIELSAQRIKLYHETSKVKLGNFDKNENLGRRFLPLEKVGAYVPGGKASYPSTVLMGSIPAKVAGVEEIIITLPAINGDISDLTLAAAMLSNVDHVYTIGGAQAIAAMALGTETISKVDKIVGPGNKYVTEAKRQLYGKVGIDGIQGPSEVVVIADKNSDIKTISWDLISQAEHDEMAIPILISSDKEIIKHIEIEIIKSIEMLARKTIILESFKNRSASIKVRDTKEAIEISNLVAPEHLHLSIKDTETYLDKIKNAGLILLGQDSSIALSDYLLGPSHILPTGGSSRFASSLCVEDFMKFSNVINLQDNIGPDEYNDLIDKTITLANSEGLTAHAKSAQIRRKVI